MRSERRPPWASKSSTKATLTGTPARSPGAASSRPGGCLPSPGAELRPRLIGRLSSAHKPRPSRRTGREWLARSAGDSTPRRSRRARSLRCGALWLRFTSHPVHRADRSPGCWIGRRSSEGGVSVYDRSRTKSVESTIRVKTRERLRTRHVSLEIRTAQRFRPRLPSRPTAPESSHFQQARAARVAGRPGMSGRRRVS